MKAADAAIGPISQPQTSPDEQQWINQLRRGERAALERLIALHQDRIRRLVSRVNGWSNRQETDDLVQEVFVRALGSIKRFRGGSRLSTWLTTIAINVCRSHHRTRVFRAGFWKQRLAEQRSEPVQQDEFENLEFRERTELVVRAVRRLPAKYREVIVMHYLEGMTADEIQRVLSTSRNTVEVRLHRARKMLHEVLAPMIK